MNWNGVDDLGRPKIKKNETGNVLSSITVLLHEKENNDVRSKAYLPNDHSSILFPSPDCTGSAGPLFVFFPTGILEKVRLVPFGIEPDRFWGGARSPCAGFVAIERSESQTRCVGL